MAKATKVAQAVSKAFATGLVGFDLTITGDDGKEKTIHRDFEGSVLSIISTGMKNAESTEAYWRDNAETLITAFFGADAPEPGKGSDMLAQMRDSENMQIMYQVFQRRHSKYDVAMRALEQSKRLAESDKEQSDVQKAAYNDLIRKVRAVANLQAITVCKYWVEAHKKDVKQEQRDTPDVRQLIEEFMQDLGNRLASKRGHFADPNEQKLGSEAIQALTKVLVEDRARRAGTTSTLPRFTKAPATDASKPRTLTPAQYEEAKAAEAAAK